MPSMNDSGDLSQQNTSIGANSAIKAKGKQNHYSKLNHNPFLSWIYIDTNTFCIML